MILIEVKNVKIILDWNAPTKTSNSPIKLLVPGNPILQNEKKKKNITKIGITWTKPP